ncbi:hypothetical protein ABZ896_25490 [Streptomyces sp. NPDC047072]|uniref:hypothetical protein n=1 Tax=Streptomyces sp. NPDC047072 TaxID=3154809 RepID=UPI0033D8E483
MSLIRQRAFGAGKLSRGPVALLLLAVVLAGSPWVQRPLSDYYVRKFYVELSDDSLLRWLMEAAFAPRWEVDSDRYGSTAGLVVNDLAVLVLLAGLAFVASRPAGSRLRRLAAGVLVTAVSQFAWWGLYEAFVPDADLSPADLLFKEVLRTSLIFGLAVGVLLALLTAAPPGHRSPRRRWRQGGLGMTIPQERMPVGSTPGDVTRYLCAAAYLDEGFAERVVEDVLADEAGAVAPSPDVDLVAVARHCLTARDLRQQRDLRLTAAYAAVAVVAPLWLVVAVACLGATRRAGLQPGLSTRGRRQPDGRALIGAAVTAGIVAILAFCFGVVVSLLPTPGFLGWLLGAYLAGVPAALVSVGAAVFAYVTVVRHDLDVDRLLRTTMTRETFAEQPRPTVPDRRWIADRLTALREAQNGNVTVYSGYTPWVGFGGTRSQAQLTVPLLPADDPAGLGARPAGPVPFTVADLVGQVRERLGTVADGETSGSLVIEDRVFVSGTAVGDDERFMRTATLAPATRLSAEEVERIMLRPTGAVRHYLAVHVPLWGGDVVPSVFLHFSTVGRSLHLHIDNHVLSPVHAAYHVADRLRGPLTPGARRGLLTQALLHTGTAFFGAPFRAAGRARFEARHSRRMVDEIQAMEQDPVYDYGARTSIRELALGPEYHNYFQVVDAERITALVQRHTLAAVREFLDAHGYDTTDFRAQQQTILNQGVIQQGGTSIVGNQAIGSGASATQNIPQQPGPAALSGTGGSDK